MGVEIKELIVRAVVGPEGGSRDAQSYQQPGPGGHGQQAGDEQKSLGQRLRQVRDNHNER